MSEHEPTAAVFRPSRALLIAAALLVASCSKEAPTMPTAKGAYIVDIGDNQVILYVHARNGLKAQVSGRVSAALPAPALLVETDGCGELEFHPALGGVGALLDSDLVCFNCEKVGAGATLKSPDCPLMKVEGQTIDWRRVDG